MYIPTKVLRVFASSSEQGVIPFVATNYFSLYTIYCLLVTV